MLLHKNKCNTTIVKYLMVIAVLFFHWMSTLSKKGFFAYRCYEFRSLGAIGMIVFPRWCWCQGTFSTKHMKSLYIELSRIELIVNSTFSYRSAIFFHQKQPWMGGFLSQFLCFGRDRSPWTQTLSRRAHVFFSQIPHEVVDLVSKDVTKCRHT